MEKVLNVLESLIKNPKKISNINKSGDEFYFLVDTKYKFSLVKSEMENNYYLHFYPKNDISLEQLLNIRDWSQYADIVTYDSIDLSSFDLFDELYQILKNKQYDIDTLFDDILNN